VSHIGDLALLEDQMCLMGPDGYAGEGSPDRADALIWGLTEVLVNQNLTTGFLEFYAREARAAGGVAAPGGPQLGRLVRMLAPPGCGGARLLSGRDVTTWDGSPVEMTEDDARPLLAAGWQRATANLST
jgi:hypothetical protein